MADNSDLKKDPPEKEIKYILESLNLKKFSEGKKEIDNFNSWHRSSGILFIKDIYKK